MFDSVNLFAVGPLSYISVRLNLVRKRDKNANVAIVSAASIRSFD